MSTHKIPLLHDHHNHIGFYTALNSCLDLRDTANYNEALEKIENLNEEINIVTGWTFPKYNRNDIEKLPPVIICDQMLHDFIVNQKARDFLKDAYPDFTENIENPEWVELNLPYITRLISSIKGIKDSDLDNYFTRLENNGVYILEDMLVVSDDFINRIKGSKYKNRAIFWADHDTYLNLSDENKTFITGLKIFLDGGLHPETASTCGYISGSKGLLIHTDEHLLKLLEFVEHEQKPVSIHSVGEIGIEQLLTILENNKISIQSIRIEHAQFITKKQAIRSNKLNIILSMQSVFSYDSIIFKNTLTPESQMANNPFRMLIDEVGYTPGENLLFGSDGMPLGIKSALESSLIPPFKSQALSIDEFCKGYCLNDESYGNIKFEILDKKIQNIQVTINNRK